MFIRSFSHIIHFYRIDLIQFGRRERRREHRRWCAVICRGMISFWPINPLNINNRYPLDAFPSAICEFIYSFSQILVRYLEFTSKWNRNLILPSISLMFIHIFLVTQNPHWPKLKESLIGGGKQQQEWRTMQLMLCPRSPPPPHTNEKRKE